MSAELGLPASIAPWAAVVADGTAAVPLPRQRRARRTVLEGLSRLPQESPVALVASGPFSQVQLRRAAAHAGIAIEREYVVVSSRHSGRCVVEDHPDTMSLLWSTLAAPSPGLTRGTTVLRTLAALGGRRPPWWVLGAVSPRVATGRRTQR